MGKAQRMRENHNDDRCESQEKEQRQTIFSDQEPSQSQAIFAIEGMTCASCSMRIEKGLKKVPGVIDAQVNLATEKATVLYDPVLTGPEPLVQKVEAVGYKAIPLILPVPPVVSEPVHEAQVILALEGMTCASCSMRIEKGLKKVPGVIDAQVNLATERGVVTYDPTQTGLEDMVAKVEALGYKAEPVEQPAREATNRDTVIAESEIRSTTSAASQEDERTKRKQADLLRKRNLLILGVVLSLPVVLLSMFFMNRFPGENLLLLVLTTPVWAVVGWDFHRGALVTLRHGAANMDTLVSLGSTASYVLSVVATFFPNLIGGVTFYDTTALIVTLDLPGQIPGSSRQRADERCHQKIDRLAGSDRSCLAQWKRDGSAD